MVDEATQQQIRERILQQAAQSDANVRVDNFYNGRSLPRPLIQVRLTPTPIASTQAAPPSPPEPVDESPTVTIEKPRRRVL